MPRTAIIALDSADAAIIGKSTLAKQHKILTLSPGASAVLMDRGFDIINSAEVYTNRSHAKTVIHQQKTLQEFRDSANGLSNIQIEAARQILFYISGTASFYWQLLKNYDEIYIVEKNNLKKITGAEEAFEYIVARVIKQKYSSREHSFSIFHRWLMQAYNALLNRILKNQQKILILDGVRPSSKGFAKEAVKLNPDIVILAAHRPLKSVFVTLRAMKKSLTALNKKDYFTKRAPMYFLYPSNKVKFSSQVKQIIDNTKSPFAKKIFTLATPYLANCLELTAAYENSAKTQLQNLKPNLIITDNFASNHILALGKGAKDLGIKTILFNHASYTLQTNPTSRAVMNMWASFGVVYSPFASYIAARSPAVAKLAIELGAKPENIIAVRNGETALLAANKKFKILFAGNYLGINEHVPWIMETPDEFIKGIAELISAVANLPDVELIIRVKPGKKDFNAEIMQKIIPAQSNVTISNEGSFKEALLEADLLVASISSTIDEALAIGRPVLLHSWPKRYQHLPETNGSVYASKKNEDLGELLKKIIAAHKPLSQTELVWPESEGGISDLAAKFVLI